MAGSSRSSWTAQSYRCEIMAGITRCDLPHIFHRFYRAPIARGMPGSGLGLAIVRQVAELTAEAWKPQTHPGAADFLHYDWSTKERSSPTSAASYNMAPLLLRDSGLGSTAVEP